MHTDPEQLPEEEEGVPPGDDGNDEPTPPLPADPGRTRPERDPAVSLPAASDASRPPREDEPDMDGEPDIPSDGRDPEGEEMIRQLDKPTELASEKPQAL